MSKNCIKVIKLPLFLLSDVWVSVTHSVRNLHYFCVSQLLLSSLFEVKRAWLCRGLVILGFYTEKRDLHKEERQETTLKGKKEEKISRNRSKKRASLC